LYLKIVVAIYVYTQVIYVTGEYIVAIYGCTLCYG